jgi:hypothetical protein
MPCNEHKTRCVEIVQPEPCSRGAKYRSIIMALSMYSVYKAWKRDVAAERAAAQEMEEVPLGYC